MVSFTKSSTDCLRKKIVKRELSYDLSKSQPEYTKLVDNEVKAGKAVESKSTSQETARFKIHKVHTQKHLSDRTIVARH